MWKAGRIVPMPVAGRRGMAVAAVATVLAAGVAAVLGGSAAGQSLPGSDAFIEQTTFTLAAGHAGDAVAPCPPGRRVTGGGVNTTGPAPDILGRLDTIQLSGPLDETGQTALTADGDVARYWYAYVHNGSGEPRDFKVFALCSRTSDATIQVQAETVPPGLAVATSQACPAGTRVVGGGVGTTGAAPAGAVPIAYDIHSSAPLADSPGPPPNGSVATRWRGAIRNRTRETRSIRVFALCSATSDAVTARADLDLPAQAAGSTTAACPFGRRVTGGGVAAVAEVGGVLQLSGPQDETGLTADTDDGDVPRYWYGYVYRPEATLWSVVVLCARDAATAGSRGGGGPGSGSILGGDDPAPTRCDRRAATVRGSDGPDVLRGTARADVIAAGAGADRVLALGGPDLICGGPGADRLTGGRGADRLLGQGGRDRLLGGPGADVLDDGAARDACLGGGALDRAACERRRGL